MLGQYIKKQRKVNELTQEQIAQELGISRTTYVQVESNSRELTLSEAQKLASIFNLTLEEFLEKKDSRKKLIIENKKKEEKTNDIRIQQKDLKKFKEVLLYILNKVGAKENVGETVLHKLLYFIDFDYYEKYEENLMGASYIKNHHGPTSKELGAIIKHMEEEKEIKVVKYKYFSLTQKKYLPNIKPNLQILSAREIKHIDNVLERLSDKNAKEIENYSHQDIPWVVAKEGEEISYESVFYRDEKYSVKDYADEI